MRRLVAAFVAASLVGCGGGAGSGMSIAPGSQGAQSDSAQSVSKSTAAIEANTVAGLSHSRIKHVFVLIQENHTFEQYFGLYPGSKGQTVENLGSSNANTYDCEPDPMAGGCQRPFLISANPSSPNYVQDAPDINGGSNGRFDQQAGIDHGKMDGYLADDEGGAPALGPTPSPAQIEEHNEDLAIEAVYDCDTVPYLWYYAKNFALYDHYFQANTGDSTPSNIQIFSGQTGQTEAASGVAPLLTQPVSGGYSDGVPISNDDNPPASNISFIPNSYGPDNSQYQSYATMPVMLNPNQDAQAATRGAVGLIDSDITKEAKVFRQSVPWAWYEEGLYTGNFGFSAHHTAPLYFDYINNAKSAFATQKTLRDNAQGNGLISDIQNGTLPSEGVFYVKGGNSNSYGLKPADSIFTSGGNSYYVGDDDHPGTGSSDHQVAEAYLANVINAIASSKYWKDSVIIVTWDDSGGMFDYLPPSQFGATCPQDATGPEEGYSCGEGTRLPAFVISPFSKTGAVIHTQADHGSISKFIETVFGLPKFGSLPNEQPGVKAGLSPADGNPATSDLTDALDLNKLAGYEPINPPALAEIPSPSVPPAMSCSTLGMTPVAAPAPLPAGFETAGYYLHQQLMGAPVAPAAIRRDDND